MDAQFWLKNTFTKENPPNWICPTCNIGNLIIDDKNFLYEQTALSKSWVGHEDWEIGWVILRFMGLLRCKNPECEESVAISGMGNVEEVSQVDDEDYYTFDQFNVFQPTYFNPPLNIFTIPANCPQNIKKEIIIAFELYWSNAAACSNKIRIVLELIMDDQKIPRYSNKNGKRNRLVLHTRLKKFEVKNQEVAKPLLAIKWIGNSGSHVGEIEKIDLINAFELLEYSLNKIYDSTEKRLIKMSERINKIKGVLSKSKK